MQSLEQFGFTDESLESLPQLLRRKLRFPVSQVKGKHFCSGIAQHVAECIIGFHDIALCIHDVYAVHGSHHQCLVTAQHEPGFSLNLLQFLRALPHPFFKSRVDPKDFLFHLFVLGDVLHRTDTGNGSAFRIIFNLGTFFNPARLSTDHDAMLDVEGEITCHRLAPGIHHKLAVIGVSDREESFLCNGLLRWDAEHSIGLRRPFQVGYWLYREPNCQSVQRFERD